MESDTRSTSKSTIPTSQSQFKYFYTPTPEHWIAPGIPARNLTAEDVERYGEQNIINSQCYQLAEVAVPEPEIDESED